MTLFDGKPLTQQEVAERLRCKVCDHKEKNHHATQSHLGVVVSCDECSCSVVHPGEALPTS